MARGIPIHQSLHRHNLVLGAERELTMTAAGHLSRRFRPTGWPCA